MLRIPTLKIKMVSKKEVFEANLKTECDLWHLMVKEMWAGKKLADDHKVWKALSLYPDLRLASSCPCLCDDARPVELGGSGLVLWAG